MAEEYKITVMYGVMTLEPLKYVLRKFPNGTAEMVGDFGTMTGEYDSILAGAIMAGMKFTIEEVSA